MIVAAAISGCATLTPRSPVPQELVATASVPGLGSVRFWGDEAPKDAVAGIRQMMPGLSRLAESPPQNGKPVVNYLAVSSGGDAGAFAAGLLVGSLVDAVQADLSHQVHAERVAAKREEQALSQ